MNDMNESTILPQEEEVQEKMQGREDRFQEVFLLCLQLQGF